MVGRRQAWWLRVALSLVIGAALLATLADKVALIPADLSFPLASVPLYALALATYASLRAVRWHALVAPLGRVPWRTSLLVGYAGSMWIALLPLRLGELARPLFLAQKTDVSASRVLGAVALERVVDGLVMCGLFFVTVHASGASAGARAHELGWLFTAGNIVSAVLLTALLVLLGMARWPRAFGRMVTAPLRLLSPRLAATVEAPARGVAEGLAALPSARPLLVFLAVTAVYWTVNATTMWLVARALGLDLDLVQAGAVMSVLGLALLVPGGPAQAGPFQLGIVLGLGLFLAPELVRDLGSRYVFQLYVGYTSCSVAFGLWAHHRLRLDWRAMLQRSRDPGQETP